MSENTNEQKQKRQNILIILLIIGMAICMAVTVWAVFFRQVDTLSPDYPPQGVETGQTPIEDDDSSKIDSPDGGGAINVTFGTTATASLSGQTVSLYYANPNASNQNVSVLVMVEDLVVAKSELITPGHQLTQLTLEKEAAQKLQVGGYNAELVVRAYDPVSGEKAMVDTKGEITLTVTE